MLGNALVGNPAGAVASEFALAGPTLEATDTHACVVAGAPFRVTLNGKDEPIGRTFTVRSGDVLALNSTSVGVRGYLCVAGGFTAEETLGSRSAWEPLRTGDELHCPASTIRSRFLAGIGWLPERLDVLRVLPGGHAPLFAGQDFTTDCYEVTPESNRMGLRLRGQPLQRPAGELLSAPVCPGTVQVTNDGQLIVLGVDAQTIGGYPRLAQVIRADLDKLGQLQPGQQIRFKLVDLSLAEELHRQAQAELRGWIVRLENTL
jgi:antagonist of KipI